MKRISKLMALLLALALLLTVAVPAIATEEKKEDTNRNEYDLMFNASVQALYQQFMACTTYEEVLLVLDNMTWDDFDAFVASLSEEDADALQQHVTALYDDYILRMEETIMIQPVNFTRAAKFKPPVQGSEAVSSYALRSAPMLLDGDNGGETEPADNGLEVSKTVSESTVEGQYTITLEAYATGEMVTTSTETAIPTDIVLVLDQSGSMQYCMRCGNAMNDWGWETTCRVQTDYFEVYSPNQSSYTAYYIIKDGSYQRVYYCSGNRWNGCPGGWYLNNHLWSHDTSGGVFVPKTSENDTNADHVQFYTNIKEYESHDISRLTALERAVTAFVDSVNAKAKGEDGEYGTADDVPHRIAIVGFSSSEYDNTEVFIGSTGYDYYNGDAAGVYGQAFQKMYEEAGYNNIVESIGALTANGGTQTQDGIDMANGIFAANPIPATEKRNRVVIVFTDGVPGDQGFEDDVADSAIDKANTAKNTYGATVYSVGIFSGADATSAGNSSGTDEQKANWFMQNVSSNNGKVQDPSYYLSASDSTALTNIFQKISSDIESGGSSSTLTKEAVVKDIISGYFQLPAGANESQIKVYTAEVDKEQSATAGQVVFGERNTFNDAEIVIDGRTVSVSNFDFSGNWVGTETNADGSKTYRGTKLIIEFDVEPIDDFLGGNGVPTNGEDSGVYADADATVAVENFVVPEVDVPVKQITPQVVDQNIYLTNEADLTALLKSFDSRIDGTNNDYVNITYTIKEDGKEIATYTIKAGENIPNSSIPWNVKQSVSPALTADTTTYTISCTVEPSKDGSATKKDGEAPAKVNVFKPEITFQDSVVEYLATYDFPDYYESTSGGNNKVSVIWKHTKPGANGEEVETAGTLEGQTIPTLVCTYSVSSDAISMNGETGTIKATEDIEVNVTVTVSKPDPAIPDSTAWDITGHTTFVHQDCTLLLDPPCTWNDDWTSHNGKATKTDSQVSIPEFLIHVKNIVADLTITKTGLDKYAYNDVNDNNEKIDRECAIINVTATGKDGVQTYRLALSNGQSVTIKDLKVGTEYTITEEDGWTWRYSEQTPIKKKIEANPDNDQNKNNVTITNIADNPYWLGGDNYKVNKFRTNNAADSGNENVDNGDATSDADNQ